MSYQSENIPQGQTCVAEQGFAPKTVVPVTRVAKTEDAVELTLEVPGIAREDVELSLERRRLTVRAQAAGLETPKGARVLISEIEPVAYLARFELPHWVDLDGIVADMTAGILSVSLPREHPERRSIPVQG